MENSFEVGAKKFKLGKIDAFNQFHIVRRIGPLIAELVPTMGAVTKAKVDGLSEEEKLAVFGKIAEPIMTGLARLSDADAEYVLFRLLASVEVYQDAFGTWAKIASSNGLMIQDLELPVLLQAAGRALAFNLSGFFDSLPRK